MADPRLEPNEPAREISLSRRSIMGSSRFTKIEDEDSEEISTGTLMVAAAAAVAVIGGAYWYKRSK